MARREDYSVQMPKNGNVYADTVTDETITIQDVNKRDGFVTYSESMFDGDIITKSMQRFLACIASGRFVCLGESTETDKSISTGDEIVNVFEEIYGVDPRTQDPVDIARVVISDKLSKEILRDG